MESSFLSLPRDSMPATLISPALPQCLRQDHAVGQPTSWEAVAVVFFADPVVVAAVVAVPAAAAVAAAAAAADGLAPAVVAHTAPFHTAPSHTAVHAAQQAAPSCPTRNRLAPALPLQLQPRRPRRQLRQPAQPRALPELPEREQQQDEEELRPLRLHPSRSQSSCCRRAKRRRSR